MPSMPTRARRWVLLTITALAAGNLVLLALPPVRQARWIPVVMLTAGAAMSLTLHLLARPLSRNRSRKGP
mgnify:CR=1 FL=1